MKRISVCINIRYSSGRFPPRRMKARLIARGTGSELYTSKPCETEEEARSLAHKYLDRHPEYELS